jgi:ATP-binding protein involved in chromosome partitioning
MFRTKRQKGQGMSVTREKVLEALGAITLPDGGTLISRDLVRALVIEDGAVRFVIETDTADAAKALAPVRQAAEAALRRWTG